MNEAKVWIIEQFNGTQWNPYYSGVQQTLERAMDSLWVAYSNYRLTKPTLRLRNVVNDDFIMGEILYP